MLIKDLLTLSCMGEVIDKMANAWENDQEGWKKAYEGWIKRLMEIDPDPSEKDNICIAIRMYDPLSDEGEMVYSDIFRKDEIGRYEIDHRLLEADPDQMTDDEIQAFIDTLDGHHIDSYGYEFSPWSETLGVEVFMDSFYEHGLVDPIVSILEDMSFNGIWEEQQDERRKELEESAREVEEIMALPEEEREGRFVKASDVFADLNKKYGFQDTRTPDEKEKERLKFRKKINREGLTNRIAKERAIARYKKSLQEENV